MEEVTLNCDDCWNRPICKAIDSYRNGCKDVESKFDAGQFNEGNQRWISASPYPISCSYFISMTEKRKRELSELKETMVQREKDAKM